MRRLSTIAMSCLFLIAACDDKGNSGEVKTASVADKKNDSKAAKADAKDDSKSTEKADPKAGEKADAKDENSEEEAKKAEARKKRMDESYAKLEEWSKKESERWNDDVNTKVEELIASDFKGVDDAMKAVMASPHRHPDNLARDEHRHPAETLKFFGMEPSMTVVEVGPGGGWYTELLAPVLAKSGKLVVNTGDPNGDKYNGGTLYAKRFEAFTARSEAAFGKIDKIVQTDKDKLNLGEAASADMVLIIRGLHGRVTRDEWDKYMTAIHEVLKDGGTLGVVQHRAKDDADPKKAAEMGYLPEAWVIEQIEKAGFKLEEKSDVNANDKDTKDYEEGVWTLPPTLTLGDKDKDKYVGIGESDRMTLRFKKAAAS